MLDVARHFFEVEEVKNFIDQLAFYKMNVLHLHLSDDQGWRIEIKSWPNLTTHGGKTEVGGGVGGFYTQDQYSEIVKYAQERCLAHVYFLIGFRNRFSVIADWVWSYLTFQRGSRLITGSLAPASTQTNDAATRQAA
jgi:hypothetical protein